MGESYLFSYCFIFHFWFWYNRYMVSIITTIFGASKDKKNNNMLKDKEAIIFDLDGTLIDSVNLLNEVYAVMVKDVFGKVVSANQIQDDWGDFICGNSDKDNLAAGFILFLNKKYNNDKEINIEELRKLHSDMESYFLENKIEYKKYAKETIALLKKKNFKLALATSSPRSTLDVYNYKNTKLNSEFKLYDTFDLVLTHDDVKKKKPDPEIYLTAVKRIGVPKDKCLIVEDSLEGVKAANNAGIDVLNVVDEYMFATQKQIDKICTYKMNSLKEFYELLKREAA